MTKFRWHAHPATPALLDVDSYIRYIAINAWGGNWYLATHDYFASRNTILPPPTLLQFGWDIENTMGNNLSRSPLNADVFAPPTKRPATTSRGPTPLDSRTCRCFLMLNTKSILPTRCRKCSSTAASSRRPV